MFAIISLSLFFYYEISLATGPTPKISLSSYIETATKFEKNQESAQKTTVALKQLADLNPNSFQWFTTYQQAVENPGTWGCGTQSYQNFTQLLWEVFLKLPSKTREQYERTHGDLAKNQLRIAQRFPSVERYDEVAYQFRFTAAGRKAAKAVALLHLDAGRALLASYYWDALKEDPDVKWEEAELYGLWLTYHLSERTKEASDAKDRYLKKMGVQKTNSIERELKNLPVHAPTHRSFDERPLDWVNRALRIAGKKFGVDVLRWDADDECSEEDYSMSSETEKEILRNEWKSYLEIKREDLVIRSNHPLYTKLAIGNTDYEKSLKKAKKESFEFVDLEISPKGTKFMMGLGVKNPRRSPRSWVILTKPIEAGRTEVTYGQWSMVMGESLALVEESNPWFNFPVVDVSWEEVQKFILKLNELDNDYLYSLPTEAQWEYLARGNSPGVFSFGDNPAYLETYAWWRKSALPGLRPVAELWPNDFGLYDVQGNVAEWVSDWFGPPPPPFSIDPSTTTSGAQHLHTLRGGSFRSTVHWDLMLGLRTGIPPLIAASDKGFRLVRVKRNSSP